jgi:hypothetical protein
MFIVLDSFWALLALDFNRYNFCFKNTLASSCGETIEKGMI